MKNYVALIGSLLFYSWGAPKVVFYLVIFSYFDYIISTLFVRYREFGSWPKYLLTSSIIANIGLLVYFKYSNFFFHEANIFLLKFGIESYKWTDIVLPIGISFFTFQKISYVIDVYRGTTKPAKHFSDFLLYVALFPQLIAGPIIRYHDVEKQIRSRDHSLDNFFYGLFRFSIGLGKKILIADTMGQVADKVFSISAVSLPVSYTWIGIICYSFQIYFDFSGYSDMAIGMGRMMGFHYRENFNMPYISQSITEFWRRWHISLSSWMKEYLYIPLGGNRISPLRTYVNLWIVFLISGLWHGASWTFILWGAYHGFFLSLDRLFQRKRVEGISKIVGVATTYLIVLFSWVVFRSPDFDYAVNYYLRMLNITKLEAQTQLILWQELVCNRTLLTLGVAILISFFPAFPYFNRLIERISFSKVVRDGIKFASIAALLTLSIASLCTVGFNPFIYFRF
jgi:alginate O-acetyltransferase complex protein AlgI